ncbi:MAG: hypothetical protein BWY17_00506 [Deltaproteobacteria bacterium ADurb.Bin207]|nr:MAG: hypothetical protein BWY17_00506 [Deltaproteobacteria bacterium ADurb.Bin207]
MTLPTKLIYPPFRFTTLSHSKYNTALNARSLCRMIYGERIISVRVRPQPAMAHRTIYPSHNEHSLDAMLLMHGYQCQRNDFLHSLESTMRFAMRIVLGLDNPESSEHRTA